MFSVWGIITWPWIFARSKVKVTTPVTVVSMWRTCPRLGGSLLVLLLDWISMCPIFLMYFMSLFCRHGIICSWKAKAISCKPWERDLEKDCRAREWGDRVCVESGCCDHWNRHKQKEGINGWVGKTHVQFLLILQKMQQQMLNKIFRRDVETKNGANPNSEILFHDFISFFFFLSRHFNYYLLR